MWLVDLNVLLYAINVDSPEHATARAWLDGALSGEREVGFAETVLLGFLRLATNPAVFPVPLTTAEACSQLEAWLGASSAVRVRSGDDHIARLCQCLEDAGTRGNRVSDAHLAALAMAHNAPVVSFDRDFARFAGVALEVPPPPPA